MSSKEFQQAKLTFNPLEGYHAVGKDVDRFGGEPWPWPAIRTGHRIVFPLNKPLATDGLKITYQGMVGSDGFQLDIVIQRLDSDINYTHEFRTAEAGKGFSIDDKQFVLDKITPLYIRLSSIRQESP